MTVSRSLFYHATHTGPDLDPLWVKALTAGTFYFFWLLIVSPPRGNYEKPKKEKSTGSKGFDPKRVKVWSCVRGVVKQAPAHRHPATVSISDWAHRMCGA